jgi:c-di-GMP-binding flagellar brake protein YcgR
MDVIDVKAIMKNDIIKFINPNKTIVDGQVIKTSNDYLGVKINVKQNTYIELNINQLIELILVYRDEDIRCSSVILGSKQSDTEQIIIISIPKLILRIQRRKFERLSIALNLEYSLLSDGVDYKKLNKVELKYFNFRYFRRAYTIDISAGGVNIAIPKDVIPGKFALVILLLKDEKIITLCRKIRTDSMDNTKHTNSVSFMYDDIKYQHRQLIIDFISEKSKEIL